MRMRIRATHSSSLVLEYLNPSILLREFVELLNPRIDNSPNFLRSHYRQSFIGLGMEAHHSTRSSRPSCYYQNVITIFITGQSLTSLEQRIVRLRRNRNFF